MDSIEDKSSDAYTILDAQSSILYDEAINEEILCSLESGSCLSTAINSSFDSYIEVFRMPKTTSPENAQPTWTIFGNGFFAVSQGHVYALSGT